MSFKVKDLTVVVSGTSGFEELSTCTGWTKPSGSGCSISLFFGEDEGQRSGLSALKTQLRTAMARV